jgi:ankyrin repeat protein
MVEILLKNNADPTIKNNNGSTAYDLAHSHGRKLVAYILAEAEVSRSSTLALQM